MLRAMTEQVLRPDSACARCGRLFFCGAHSDGCWCDGLTLSDHQRRALSVMKLEGCLCPDCLEAL
jgi:hypothetical protein